MVSDLYAISARMHRERSYAEAVRLAAQSIGAWLGDLRFAGSRAIQISLYRSCTGDLRGASSPPEYCSGSVEQASRIPNCSWHLIGDSLLNLVSFMHVFRSRFCLCLFFGPVYVKESEKWKDRVKRLNFSVKVIIKLISFIFF